MISSMLETTPQSYLATWFYLNKTEPVSLIVKLEGGYEWHRHADQPRERAETNEKTITTTPTNDKHPHLDFLIELVPYPTNSSSE